MILRTFAPAPCSGTIVAGGDNGPWAPEPGDQDLYLTLTHQRWTDTPIGFLPRHPGDLLLLPADAFAAFLPAWLLVSPDNESQGAECAAHTCAPDAATDPSSTNELQAGELNNLRERSIAMLRPLAASQRHSVCAVLEPVAHGYPSALIADHRAAAAPTVDNLVLAFESGSL